MSLDFALAIHPFKNNETRRAAPTVWLCKLEKSNEAYDDRYKRTV